MHLIIRCPRRPVANNFEDWSALDLYFSWANSDEVSFHQVLDLDTVPVAATVLAIVPDIDARLTELKVPAVSEKKILQLLPMLMEDELLSPVADTNIQLFAPSLSRSADRRLVSVMDREWLLWLSQQLAEINCEQIRLIPESLLLPVSESVVYFQQEDATMFYTFKKSAYETICWAQPSAESVLSFQEQTAQIELRELSVAILMNGIATEKKSYETINLLPEEFYGFRTERQSEAQHWFSRDLWKQPLKWAKYATLTLCVSYVCYVMTLLWQDRQWEAVLAQATKQVLSDSPDSPASFTRLVNASCLAAHKNLEHCGGDFEKLLLALQNILKGTPPEALKGLEYSKMGLVFDLQEAALSDNQRLALLQDSSIRRLGPERFLLSPYASLAYE